MANKHLYLPTFLQLILLNGVYNGIARTFGALIAGKVQSLVGTAQTFLVAALVTLAVAMLVAIRAKLSIVVDSEETPTTKEKTG